ncbi:prenyltransferase [Paenibacillus roseipurpureus]|uniref:Prenyltransferase n=1 Tax=Paenibacillus roseopurpureus TaxID=2918901 RepID=A0AA96LQS9_9BACL|nr:prenyltransferase [Paenibacillus sp. MBLB1832]WNR46320.1 prenyltransferase [Paenibacillus sp. MBLB1832]
MNNLSLFLKASRFRVIPVMVIPVVLGGLGAIVWNDTFHPYLFVLTFIGSIAAHLFSNMINDLWDFRNGIDTAAKETASAISTNSGFLANGTITLRLFSFVTWAIFALALVCGLILSLTSGWLVLLFGGLGGLIAYFYVAPPIKFGYRGKGYSEIAILLSFGILPTLGSYYVQTMQVDYRPLLLSLPIGLFTTLILFNHHFLHWQADRTAGKRTLVVVWGEKRALLFSKSLCALSYIVLITCVLVGVFPYYTLIALLTAVPLIKVYRNLKSENPSPAYLPLMGASLKATTRSGLIMMLALVVQAILN